MLALFPLFGAELQPVNKADVSNNKAEIVFMVPPFKSSFP